MRRLLAMLMMAAPMASFAAVKPPDTDWHRCAADADCVLVEGICGKAAVNRGFEGEAIRYYAAQSTTANCRDEFWKPKNVVARCHLESCEVIGKP